MELNINKDIFRELKVKLVYLFGSRAKGSSAENSDFDIAVLFGENLSEPLALKETDLLLRKLRAFSAVKFDIVSLNNASLLLKHEVVSSGKILYCENELDKINFEVSVTKKYIDGKPLRKLYGQALHKKILERA